MNKIGILTFHWADDFGGMLQAYALKHFLDQNKIGQAQIIPYETAALRGRYWLLPYRPKYANHPITGTAIKREAKFIFRNLHWKLQRMWKMRKFRRHYLTDVKKIRSAEKLGKLSYDMIVLGSDQVWNPDITYRLEKAYFGAFPKKENTVTVSYAASLGKPELEAQYSKEFRNLIQSVDVISVREESSIPYVQKQSGKTVQHMPDPTLLLSRQEWEEIAETPEETEYVLLHCTEYNEELVKQAILYGKEKGLPVISLKSVNIPGEDIQLRFGIGPAEFLGYIQNAACVFTNSFHATVFSLIFEKNFCCIAHSKLGSRTNDLLNHFGVENRGMNTYRVSCCTGSEKQLKEFRDKAYRFFQDSTSYRKADISPHCKGCGACVEICPQKAVMLKVGQDGFSYPYINEKLCNHCGKCSRICPDSALAPVREEKQIYGCKCRNEDIRSRSTSGGIFYLLAEQIILRGGCVYGAILNQENEVHHVCAQSIEQVLPMQGAKYVESKLGNCYAQIREQLSEGPVLFTGTPCQVAGLKALAGDHPNLYTVDIVCHGVASPKVFSKYMRWLEKKGTVSGFRFRSKATGWHTSSVSYVQGGTEHLERMGQNPYTKLYFRGLISRNSCHSCQYTSFHRCSDMTIGDYWGIEKVNPEFDDNRGTSLVILHSRKGQEMFEQIRENVAWFSASQEQCLQPQLQWPAPKNENRDRLMQDLDRLDFETIFKKYYLLSNKEQLKKRLLKKRV